MQEQLMDVLFEMHAAPPAPSILRRGISWPYQSNVA